MHYTMLCSLCYVIMLYYDLLCYAMLTILCYSMLITRAISLVGRTTHSSSEDYDSVSHHASNSSSLKDDSYKIDTSSAQLGA